MIPTLETERLRLRAWRMDDFEALADFVADPDLSRYRTNAPLDRAGAWFFMCGQLGQWQLRGYGIFAVALRQNDEAIGYTGLYHPEFFAEPELSWSLFRNHHGRGYAIEMAAAARDWAGNVCRLPPVISLVHPDNGASRKVAERLGASIEGEADYFGQPRLIYRHLADGRLSPSRPTEVSTSLSNA